MSRIMVEMFFSSPSGDLWVMMTCETGISVPSACCIAVSPVQIPSLMAAGIPRFWTGVGIVLTIIGSWWLYEPVTGTTLRPSWITLLAGVGGVMLAFIVGMPSMVRTRFATPTVGREWMIGADGTAIDAIDPEGTVQVGDAQWRARTNRATPIPAGDPLKVIAIDGVTLEVEPIEGAARDHRERRRARQGADTGTESSDA